MGKLHELLAVEGSLKSEAHRLLHETTALFKQGTERLVGRQRLYQPLEEGVEQMAPEVTVLATNVQAEMEKFLQGFGAWIDAAIQKEVTNCDTAADVTIDGKVILSDLPAVALLNLESKLAEMRTVYAAIPTNDPTESWNWDDQDGFYVSEPRTTYRTEKRMETHVAYPATEQHPAQVETYTKDVRVGTWTTVIQSGMLAPTEKARLMSRLDALLRAVRQARQRANDHEIIKEQVAERIFRYIHEQ